MSHKNDNELKAVLDGIRAKGDNNMSEYHRSLLKWYRNVDKRYAWVVLTALFFMMTATLGPYRVYGLIFAKVTSDGIYTREEASWPVSMIFSVENLIGPFVSIISYHLTYHQSMLIGGVLLALGNGLCVLSKSIVADIILLGVIQGIGYAFIFMPFMETINSYFLRYRNTALGIALCGGTLSIFVWSPIFQWSLDYYPWRYTYIGLGLVCCINILMVPLLRPNPMPTLQAEKANGKAAITPARKISRMSARALTYQNSVRRQSTILINRNSIKRQASVISVNPFANSVGLERKISRAIVSSEKPENNTKSPVMPQFSQKTDFDENETMSLSEIGQESVFEYSVIWDVLKKPAFHLIWYNELIYFWIFSIYCLVMVDYAVDHGCKVEEAESMLNYQSIGELLGRLVLPMLVDLKIISNKNVVIIILLVLSGLLFLITIVQGIIWLACITVAISAFLSLLYIVLNGLLVDYLGERQVTIGYGMASCIGGLLMTFRPSAVGYFRDELGSYDPLMQCLALSCIIGALLWIFEPLMTKAAQRCAIAGTEDSNQESIA